MFAGGESAVKSLQYHAVNAALQSSHTCSKKSRYRFRLILLKDPDLDFSFDNRHITRYISVSAIYS